MKCHGSQGTGVRPTNSRWEGLDKKADVSLGESWKKINSLEKKQDAHKSFQHLQKQQSLARCLQHKKPKVYGITVLMKQHCSLFVQMYSLHSPNSSNKNSSLSLFFLDRSSEVLSSSSVKSLPSPTSFFLGFSFLSLDTWSHYRFFWAHQSIIQYFRFGFATSWTNTRYSFIFYS